MKIVRIDNKALLKEYMCYIGYDVLCEYSIKSIKCINEVVFDDIVFNVDFDDIRYIDLKLYSIYDIDFSVLKSICIRECINVNVHSLVSIIKNKLISKYSLDVLMKLHIDIISFY